MSIAKLNFKISKELLHFFFVFLCFVFSLSRAISVFQSVVSVFPPMSRKEQEMIVSYNLDLELKVKILMVPVEVNVSI